MKATIPTEDSRELAAGYMKYGPLSEHDLAALLDRVKGDEREACAKRLESEATYEESNGASSTFVRGMRYAASELRRHPRSTPAPPPGDAK